jgi:GT2 family glycosyltransferase
VVGERDDAVTDDLRARAGPAEPSVSVIVPVRNNPNGIRALLERLATQTLPPERFEVVIGDDGSAPGSLANVASADGRIRVVPGPPRTSYAARNRAARVARGGVLAFCDSDCLPASRWLEEGLLALESADIVAGEVTFRPPARPTLWSLLTVDMFLDQQRNVVRSRAVTANLLVRRRDFDRWGGFDESLPSGGDYEFVLRGVQRGGRLRYAPHAVVYHPTLDDRRSFLRKVWRTNRWAAIRRTRAGYRIRPSSVLTFVPVLGVAQARRHAFRSARRLERARLEAAGLTPTWTDELRALAVLYSVVGYVSSLARLRGWLASRGEGRGRFWPGGIVTEGASPGPPSGESLP